MSYHHFSTFERGRLQELFALGYSRRAIALKLHRHHSSIDREIRRNSGNTFYIGETAQASYQTRGKFSMGTPISKRPNEVKSRTTFGHWELDTMVSSRGESKGCFATFVERKSRLYTAFKIADRTAASMQSAIIMLFNVLPIGAFMTGTTDRGKEFACCTEIQAQLGLRSVL